MSFINKKKIISEENNYNISEIKDTANGFNVTSYNPQTQESKEEIINNDSRYYTESEIDDKVDVIQAAIDVVNGKVDSLVNIKIRVLDRLPDTGEENIIYFVPKNKESPDAYNEYVWVNNKYELIGNTEVDLTPYATTNWVNTELNKKANTNHNHVKNDITDFEHNHDDRYYIKSEMNTKLGEKSTVSFSQEISSGTKIGDITIDGNKTSLYAPEDISYEVASESAAGLMSASDKAKLNGIEAQANKTTVSDILNSSTQNPVKGSVIYNALSGKASSVHTHTTDDLTNVSTVDLRIIYDDDTEQILKLLIKNE